MMFSMLLILGLLLVVYHSQALAEVGCINDKNELTDWYILYKLPKNSGSEDEFIKKGEAYAILNTKKGSWEMSKYSVEDNNSHFGNTYAQLMEENTKLSYLLYNDQLPESNASTSYWGHTKGMIATDGENGFWFSHSIPRFPLSPEGNYYDYPDNAKDNGQSVICITFDVKDLPKILNHISYTMPNIYESHYTKGLDVQPENVRNFFSGAPSFIKKAPWNSVDQISSLGGQKFKVFAKHGKWDQDIYDASVGPGLETSLYVESWMSGSGTKLTSDCNKSLSVINVNAIRMQIDSKYISFKRTQDHSKWAVSLPGFQPWVCIGDINRMESQFKRGGGSICVKSAKVWKAFHSSIDDYEDCTV